MSWECFIEDEKKLKPQSANSYAHARFSVVNCPTEVNIKVLFANIFLRLTQDSGTRFCRLNTCFLDVPSFFFLWTGSKKSLSRAFLMSVMQEE